MKERKRLLSIIGTVVFSIFSIAWLIPIVIIVMNSFKKKSFNSYLLIGLLLKHLPNLLTIRLHLENTTYWMRLVGQC